MNERALMQRAVDLSLLARGRTSPNPIVGAVIADSRGEVVAQSFHEGREHAEVLALRDLAAPSSDLTLFVTLEPCNHHGKTPPCSEAIIEGGIKNVVYATKDPNPIAQGGADRLTKAGVSVRFLDYPDAAFANRDWLTKIRLGRPRFVWKVATSLDGAIAANNGSSKWITNDSSRLDVKSERSRSDAILTGTGTVLSDDPSLLGDDRNPIRIVIGNREIPSRAKIFSSGAETIVIQNRDFKELTTLVNQRGFNRIFVEAGPGLGSALFAAGLIDEILLYQAPTLLGSDRRFTQGLNISDISEQIRLSSEEISEFDGDLKRLLFTYTPSNAALNKELSCSLA
jgi:diaminohydroxyphosphoribosylaminopyrimidine deaminase/5-amino-6-(5-phosphoribosylamino)uracil reductase